MQDYATKKASRLLRFHDRISRIEIVVDGPHEAPEVEMIVHVEREGKLVAKLREDHFNVAIDGLTDKLERQLTKAKGKRRNHSSDSIRGRGEPEPPPDGDDETYEDVVRKDLE